MVDWLILDENNQEVELSPDKIYFLSHPCTSGGKGEVKNRIQEEEIYQFLVSNRRNIKVIRPLKIIPDNAGYGEAMDVCFGLMDLSDVSIFAPGWQSSDGCNDEHHYCSITNVPKLILVSKDFFNTRR